MLSAEELDRSRSKRGPRPVQCRRNQSPLELFLRAQHPQSTQPHLEVAIRVGVPPDTANKWLLSQHAPGVENAIRLVKAYGVKALLPLQQTMRLTPFLRATIEAATRGASS